MPWTTIVLGLTLGGGGAATPSTTVLSPGLELWATEGRHHLSPENNLHHLIAKEHRAHLIATSTRDS